MSRVTSYQSLTSTEDKKTPLTKMIRSASTRGSSPAASSDLSLTQLRQILMTGVPPEDFDAADQHRRVFGWLDRKRNGRSKRGSGRSNSVVLLTTANASSAH